MRKLVPGPRTPGAGTLGERPGRRATLTALVRRHRRVVAAGLLATASGLAVHSAAAEPAPGEPVLVAARDLPAGHLLSADDVTTVDLPADAVPSGALTATEADGRTLGSPAARGEALTEARLRGRGELTGAPPGTVAVPVPVSDPATLSAVEAGDSVRVLGGPTNGDGVNPATAEPAEVIVEHAVVLGTPRSGGPGGGAALVGGDVGPSYVLLALSEAEALRIADAPQRRWLGLAIIP
ncbi:MAG TPA: SAF domain-containing protein [Actinomycetales bacterium]|nr:SAF domain-containing protein [Actinomycetales bacterium]